MGNIQQIYLQNNQLSDGGIEAMLFILKYYRGNEIMVDLKDIVEAYYSSSSFYVFEKLALKCGLLAAICEDIDISTVIDYNQPIIINISNIDSEFHFVVCYSYNISEGFLIIDSKNGNYHSTVIGLQSMWLDRKCVAFSKI